MSETDTTTGQSDRPVNNPMSNNRNPYTVWFVVLSFVVPAVLAYGMYFFGDIKSFTNHGEILDPIVHINTFELKDNQGNPVPENELTYKWRMISFLGSQCDEQCQKRLYDSRQIHTSLGKNRHRVLRMFVHLEPASEALQSLIAQEHPNVIHVYGDKATILKALVKDASITNNEIYLQDPIGNVMMRFTRELPNKEILQDIKKLLKASQIG
jgi:cytochrome oxidase Cu insertion factor (SCO1/SenC/PrrC family)